MAGAGQIGLPVAARLDLVAIGRMSLVAFAIRESLAGAVQYELMQLGLGPAWFVVDLLAALCFATLAFEDLSAGKVFYLGLSVYLFAESCLGFVVSESWLAAAAGLKAILPLFVGVLCDREVVRSRLVTSLLYGLLHLCCVGVALSLLYELPWANLTADTGLGAKQVTRLSYASGGGVRGYGFASDAHSCACSIMMLWGLLGLGRRTAFYYLSGLVALAATYLTTSKTGCACFGVAFVCRYVTDRLGGEFRGAASVATRVLPSLFVFIPLAVIAFSLLVARDELDPRLMGLWDRGGKIYLQPFDFMAVYFSPAWITGFGIGGIGFPLLRTDYVAYNATVDNFDLFGYYTFGLLFVVAIVVALRWSASDRDVDRRIVFTAMVLYGQFITGWPTAPFMIMLGYSLGGFMRHGRASPPRGRGERREEMRSRLGRSAG